MGRILHGAVANLLELPHRFHTQVRRRREVILIFGMRSK
jgi:hypothetical protein